MGIEKFKIDNDFGESIEKTVKEWLEENGWNVEQTSKTSILDFIITKNKNKKRIHLELKSRRCKSLTYPNTMIWINKLIKAYEVFNGSWDLTLFLFNFEDWLYYINPFKVSPDDFSYKNWRWDRGGFDKKKWWVYYNVNSLIKIN